MPNSKLILPGIFEAGKRYWLKGETLKAWQDALIADRVVAGPNLDEFATPQGRIFSARATAADLRHLVLKQGSEPLKFQVTPGTVNDEMPTMDTVALDAEDTPETEIAVTTAFWIKVVGVFSTGAHTVTIETSTGAIPSGTEITATGFTSFRKIGLVTVAAGVGTITQNRSGGDLEVASFGNVNLWWLV
jgi:hypothetical protein